jgi:NAD-dependent SIR2 family protein deacetylase
VKDECKVQTPHYVSVDNFVVDKALFLMTACVECGGNDMRCTQCGTRIKWEAAFISAHRIAELCVGTGIIVQVDIPYCPRCEETPYTRGCFHAHDGQDVAAQLAA